MKGGGIKKQHQPSQFSVATSGNLGSDRTLPIDQASYDQNKNASDQELLSPEARYTRDAMNRLPDRDSGVRKSMKRHKKR